MILGVINLPYSLKNNNTNSTRIVVSTLDDVVLVTLEELVDSVEKQEEPPLFHGGDEENILLSDTTFSGTSGEEEEEEETSNSDKEEEDSEEEDMVDQNMDWMTQGLLALSGVLHKMPRHSEKILKKYDHNKRVKVEYHLDKFYLHLQTLEVRYDDVACRIFPCTLDG